MEAPESDTAEREVVDPADPEGSPGETGEGEATERDTTDEWRIEGARAPATVAELETRIDRATATAESAEEAALEIGAASLEAAEQARRAAVLAERASVEAARAANDAASAAADAARTREAASAAEARVSADPGAATPTPTAPAADPALPAVGRSPGDFAPRPKRVEPRRHDPFEERVTAFRLRAEKVMIRLRKLEAGAAPGDGPSEVVRLG